MSFTALVCKIAIGVGTVSVAPQLIETPRYEGAQIRIELNGDAIRDIWVTGPYDHDYGYVEHGLQLTSERSGGALLIEARAGGADFIRESLVLTDLGLLTWVQIANATQFHAHSASLFIGNCERLP